MPKAIDHNMQPEKLELDVGSIVVATGFDLMDVGERAVSGDHQVHHLIHRATRVELSRHVWMRQQGFQQQGNRFEHGDKLDGQVHQLSR